jgi:hypothetical protein
MKARERSVVSKLAQEFLLLVKVLVKIDKSDGLSLERLNSKCGVEGKVQKS